MSEDIVSALLLLKEFDGTDGYQVIMTGRPQIGVSGDALLTAVFEKSGELFTGGVLYDGSTIDGKRVKGIIVAEIPSSDYEAALWLI